LAKVGSGDSGSALLNHNGAIVGIAQSGHNRLMNLLDPIVEAEKLNNSYIKIQENIANWHNVWELYNSSTVWWKRLLRTLHLMSPSNVQKPTDNFTPDINEIPRKVRAELIQDALDSIQNLNVEIFLKEHHPEEFETYKQSSPAYVNVNKIPIAIVEQYQSCPVYQNFIANGNGAMFGNTYKAISQDIMDWINEIIEGLQP
jgi:hypothetical protein